MTDRMKNTICEAVAFAICVVLMCGLFALAVDAIVRTP